MKGDVKAIKKLFFVFFLLFTIGYIINQTLNDEMNHLSFKKLYNNEENNWNLSRNIKIAIIDSGIEENHESLQGKVVQNINFSNKNEKKVKDDFNHGTAIAGIITGKSDFTHLGLAPNAQLYDIKVLNSKGQAEITNVIEAINWSINNKIDIINMSFGFKKNHIELYEAIKKAYEKGIIIVASAGNNIGLEVDYPARYQEVISVGAINSDLSWYNLSSKGKIDFVAPGIEIIAPNNNGGYESFSGTSFSTAYVTASIANILGREKNIDHSNDILKLLKPYLLDLGDKGYDEKYGYGLINLYEGV